MTDLSPKRLEQTWPCAAAVAVEGVTKVFPIPFSRRWNRRKPNGKSDNLKRRHRSSQSIVAVRDLNLRVERGEVYGLLGPNGSGKSTTLKIILGLVSPTLGRTKIFGRDSSQVESRETVGFLPENPSFYNFLTGEVTLRFVGRLCRLPYLRIARDGWPNERATSTIEWLLERNAATDRACPGPH